MLQPDINTVSERDNSEYPRGRGGQISEARAANGRRRPNRETEVPAHQNHAFSNGLKRSSTQDDVTDTRHRNPSEVPTRRSGMDRPSGEPPRALHTHYTTGKYVYTSKQKLLKVNSRGTRRAEQHG